MYPTHILENQLAEKDILSGPLEKTNEGYALAKISILKLCTYLNKEKILTLKPLSRVIFMDLMINLIYIVLI